VAVGHRTRYYSPTVVRSRAAYVRGGFGYSCFTPAWYRTHSVAWVAPRWIGPSVWVAPPWRTVSVYCGVTAAPVVYDYGSTVVIEDNRVYVNGTSVGSAAEYAGEATQFADRGREATPTDDEQWQPLGVFGMVQGEEETTAQHIFQLAVNPSGVVRGNYYDALADNTIAVYGSVDRASQRVLVHYGDERTEQMLLVRLEEPQETGQ
jgi:hypothetical protein